MLTALIAALLVSLTAAIVLKLTYQRFHLSKFGSGSGEAFRAAEAGVLYARARLGVDTSYTDGNFPGVTGFSNVVKAAKDASGSQREYIVTSGDPNVSNPDLVDSTLQMGGRHVTVYILYRGTGAVPEFKIRATCDYATAQEGF